MSIISHGANPRTKFTPRKPQKLQQFWYLSQTKLTKRIVLETLEIDFTPQFWYPRQTKLTKRRASLTHIFDSICKRIKLLNMIMLWHMMENFNFGAKPPLVENCDSRGRWIISFEMFRLWNHFQTLCTKIHLSLVKWIYFEWKISRLCWSFVV